MERRLLNKMILSIFVLSLVLGFGAGYTAAEVEKVEWKVQSIYPATATTTINVQKVARIVDVRTGGKFKIQVFMPGQMVKTRELFDAVRTGMVDGGVANIVYYSRVVPVANAKYGPFLAMNNDELAYLQLDTEYLKPIRKELSTHNIFFVLASPTHPAAICLRKIVKTLDGMKGLKIRGAGIYNDVSKAWGAVPISIAPAEMYTALQRGTMDGVYYPIVAAVNYKLYEQLKCAVVRPAPFCTSADIFVNLDSFNALPVAWRNIFLDACFDVLIKDAVAIAKTDYENKLSALRKSGVKVVLWSDDDVKKAKELCKPYRAKYAAASPASAEVIRIAEKALTDYRQKHSIE